MWSNRSMRANEASFTHVNRARDGRVRREDAVGGHASVMPNRSVGVDRHVAAHQCVRADEGMGTHDRSGPQSGCPCNVARGVNECLKGLIEGSYPYGEPASCERVAYGNDDSLDLRIGQS